MGFTIYYRSTEPVGPAEEGEIRRAANAGCLGRTWLSCEPVHFFPGGEGHLLGGSKPNFQPHPNDVASAALAGLPDGTVLEMLDLLCQLSREHGIDWEISHDYSEGPIGYIRVGACDNEVLAQMEAFADLGEILSGEVDDLCDEDLD